MEFCSLASGSSGNCIYIGSDTTSVLVDAGLSGKQVEERLQIHGHTGQDLGGILITHEHSDHIRGLGVLARKYHIPVFLTEGTRQAISRMSSLGEIPEELIHIVREDEDAQLGDLTIHPFRISHDAAEPVGYRVSAGKHAAAVATDMGSFTEYTVRQLRDLDILLLEANHDVHMLEVGRYPYYLKLRILGEKGHLSNVDAGALLNEVLHDDIRHIFLGHLSEENNYPALAFETVSAEVTMGDSPYRAGDFPIHVATRHETGEWIRI